MVRLLFTILTEQFMNMENDTDRAVDQCLNGQRYVDMLMPDDMGFFVARLDA